MLDFIKIKLSITNCYLIKSQSGYLLIDCGNENDRKVFLRKIRRLNIHLKDIKYLLLTHHHNDHCGLLDFLVSENPSIRVIMSDKCSEYLKTGKHFHHKDEHFSNATLEILIGLYYNLRKDYENFIPFNIRAQDIIISEDNVDILAQLGVNGKIIFTKGHTEDSISVIINDVAFVGDAIRNMLNFTGSPFLPLILYSECDFNKNIAKYKNEGVKNICPAHGQPFLMDNTFLQ